MAQNEQDEYPYLRNYSFNEGLPAGTIYDIHAHTSGYLYIGSENGLIRYNGKNFTSLHTTSGPGRSISYLSEDEDSTLWGVNFYGTLYRLAGDSLNEEPSLSSQMVGQTPYLTPVAFGEDIWILYQKGLVRFHKTSRQIFSELKPIENDNGYMFIGIVRIENDLVILDNRKVLHFIDLKTKELVRREILNVQAERLYQFDGKLLYSKKDNNNEIQLFKYGEQEPLYTLGLPGKILHVSSINHQLWFCTDNGLVALHKNGSKRLLLKGLRIANVVFDFQDNLWIASLDKGLFLLPYQGLQKSNNFNQLATRLLFHDDMLWLGTGKGELYFLDQKRQTPELIKNTSPNEIEFITHDSKSNKIFSNWGYYDLDKGKAYQTPNLGKGITSIVSGSFAVARYNGVYIINKRYLELSTDDHQKMASNQRLLREGRCYALLYESEIKKLWVAQTDGLYVFDSSWNYSEAILPNGSRCYSNSLTKDESGNIYAAVQNEGIWVFKKNGQKELLDRTKWLKGAFPKKIRYQQGILWIITNSGLISYHPEHKEIRYFHEEYNLASLFIYDISFDGSTIWLATQEGVMKLRSAENRTSTPPIIVLKEVKLDNQYLTLGPNTLMQPVRNLHIEFDLIQYNSNRTGNLQYRFLGKDTLWNVLPENVQEIYVSNLDAGNYRIQARYTENDAVLQLLDPNLTINVLTPWWQKGWFHILSAIVLISATASLVIYFQYKNSLKTEKQLREQLLKLELNNSRLTALRARMNPHFIYNVFNSIQGLIYQNLKTEAGEYLVKFSHLIRSYLQLSEKQYITLQDELSTLRLYLELEAMNFDQTFQYEIDVPSEVDQTGIYIPTMILQPLVENAIKHGLMHKKGEKRLKISILPSKDCIKIAVEDNGIGRKAAAIIKSRQEVKYASFASKAISQRIELINQGEVFKLDLEIEDLQNNSGFATGTLARLSILQHNSPMVL